MLGLLVILAVACLLFFTFAPRRHGRPLAKQAKQASSKVAPAGALRLDSTVVHVAPDKRKAD